MLLVFLNSVFGIILAIQSVFIEEMIFLMRKNYDILEVWLH